MCSPSLGEYLPDRHSVRAAAARVTVPALVASTASAEERGYADPVFAALPGRRNVRLTPARAVHGASMLIETRNPGAAAIWPDVLGFLDRVTRRGR